ncbi:DNA primase DnaG [Helicobacter sp. NHP19-003]|uniref:DNA primase n=1 Tax=Helicobacter gastrocanis TaxID=2849641 RepID=A0ABM7SKG8_9HELI|nr:DNA primase [Helicobacter sp. NHP19-003]BCZ18135.1 DNA primase DnaG [Helicobacter sp. NHP19-003]
MITQESLEQLKQVADIVEVVQGYIALKKIGSNYQAICPFHDEKTPSFVVNPQRNSFRCYGCSKSGNAFTFIMEYEKVDFPTAAQKLAGIFNVPLHFTHSKEPATNMDTLEQIAQCYQAQLTKTPNALEYLRQRGVSPQSLKDFSLGFCAPPSVMDYIQAHRLDTKALLDLGVLGQDDSKKVFVRFAKRLMFAIHNPNGKVVGFGGRVLQENAQMAKYINSPQTPLFNKSKLLYGYFQARQNILKTRQLILTEGYLDVILLHQAGFNTAVATLGTALTPEHLPILSRGNPSIILLYDGDKAGRAAAFKASQLLAKELKSGGVVLLTPPLDPADMILQGQADDLKALLARPIPFIEFVLQGIVKEFNLNDPLQKKQAFEQIQAFLRDLPPIVQEDYKPMAASLLQTSLRFFNPQKPKPQPLQPLAQRPISDPLEELLIKYMALYPELLERAKVYIKPEVFRHCAHAFELLCASEPEDAQIVAIKLDERLPIATPPHKDFDAQLVLLTRRYFATQLEQTNYLHADLELSQRLEMLSLWRAKLHQSNQGELVKV